MQQTDSPLSQRRQKSVAAELVRECWHRRAGWGLAYVGISAQRPQQVEITRRTERVTPLPRMLKLTRATTEQMTSVMW